MLLRSVIERQRKTSDVLLCPSPSLPRFPLLLYVIIFNAVIDCDLLTAFDRLCNSPCA